MKRFWRPPPIEEFYSKHPHLLRMWNTMAPKEEKQVPWYADEPTAKSKTVNMSGIWRTNFNPEKNRNHLNVVAEAIGFKSLPLDQNEAYRLVLDEVNRRLGIKTIWYHGTSKEVWEIIQEEQVLWGERGTPSRCTYLAAERTEAEKYGDVLLKVRYDPTLNPDVNNYPKDGDCWQIRVYEPIVISELEKLPRNS